MQMPCTEQINLGQYQLLDSGNGRKLERLGDVIVDRPSKLALWAPRLDQTAWEKRSAYYDHKSGWKLESGLAQQWALNFSLFKLNISLQRNGQIAFFPEHLSYLPEVTARVQEIQQKGHSEPRVLNLFGFTGMATVACACLGAKVWHVDLSKQAILWAQENAELNALAKECISFSRTEALRFLRNRDLEQRFDIILVDPPSFSRVSKTKTWELDQILVELVNLCVGLLEPEIGALYFTSHYSPFGSQVIENLVIDALGDFDHKLSSRSLSVLEQDSTRRLPAGHLVTLRYGP